MVSTSVISPTRSKSLAGDILSSRGMRSSLIAQASAGKNETAAYVEQRDGADTDAELPVVLGGCQCRLPFETRTATAWAKQPDFITPCAEQQLSEECVRRTRGASLPPRTEPRYPASHLPRIGLVRRTELCAQRGLFVADDERVHAREPDDPVDGQRLRLRDQHLA
jgi:hypothetical protein